MVDVWHEPEQNEKGIVAFCLWTLSFHTGYKVKKKVFAYLGEGERVIYYICYAKIHESY